MSLETRPLLDRATEAVRWLLTWPDGPLALALVLGLAATFELTLQAGDMGAAVVSNLIATLPLALVRRRLPWATGAIVVGVIAALAGDPAKLTVAAVVALAVVAYLFAARYRRGWSALAALPFVVNTVAPYTGEESGASEVLLLLVVVAALALGDGRRQRGRAIAERDEAQRDQALLAERARIARELHDVVAHHVSMISVQAETARLTTRDLSEEGKQRFEAIGRTARDSLTELRRLLGLLRTDDPREAVRAPQPGLGELDALLDAARDAGTEVRLTLSGRAAPLPPGVDLTAYRIVQEALTNARRHAPGARVDVELRYDSGTLRLEVRDEGPGSAGDGDGHGLVGMRERTALVGGTFHAGPRDGGGFEVRAELPIAEPPS